MVAVTAYADKAMLWIEGESPPCLEISISSIANLFAVLGPQPIAVQNGDSATGHGGSCRSEPRRRPLQLAVAVTSSCDIQQTQKGERTRTNRGMRVVRKISADVRAGTPSEFFSYGDRPQCTKIEVRTTTFFYRTY